MSLNVPIPLANQYSDSGISGGSNVLGNVYGGVTFNQREAAPPGFSGEYSYTSLRPVASYVVRQELQQQVETRVQEARAGGMSLSSIVVLVGLGGAGKSQLTLNYIRTHRTEYDAVFWVDARLRESLERDYIQIGRLLYGGEHKHDDVDQVVTAVKTWFAGRRGRWLFVYDNADSLEDERDLYYVDLQRYLPDAPGVEIMITSRSQIAKGMSESEAVEVGKLAHAEAVDLFLRCSKLGNADTAVREETSKIVTELDYLALAVTLAGAYVAATPRIRSDISRYLPEYRRRRRELLARRAKKQIDQYTESVLSTWETSCATLAQQCPVAVQLLGLFAFLDPEDIYWDLLRHLTEPLPAQSVATEAERGRSFPPEVFLLLKDDRIVDEALEALSMYSLIQWKEGQSGYSMHKLVHAWGFDRIGADEQERYAQGSLALLKSVTRDKGLDPIKKNRIAPHISSSVTRLREWHDGATRLPECVLYTIWLLANFLRHTGQYQSEYELRKFEEAERSRFKNEDEANWLYSRSELATALQSQCQYEAAETMNRRALERFEEVFGSEDRNTLTTLNNLASILENRGDYKAAEAVNWRALRGREKVFGKDHPDTLASVSSLAVVLQWQGKYDAAEEMCQRALETRENVLGKEHLDTLKSANNLAVVLQYQRKYEAAEAMNWRVLTGYKKMLGEDHPDTLSSVSNLAVVLQWRRKYDVAEAMFQRALERREKVLGEEHPDTLTSVNNLAVVLVLQGKYEAAEAMAQRVLEGSEKALGMEHPDTLRSVWFLAVVLTRLGQRSEAVALYERASKGFMAALGKQHPDTIKCQRQYEAAKDKCAVVGSTAVR